jgi:cobalt-zinc-cadmium efflux system outer membrane protein
MIPFFLIRSVTGRCRSFRDDSHWPVILIASAIVAFVLAVPVRAAATGLTVEAAVASAMAGNPRVLAAALEVEAARGRALQLGARPEPQLSAAIEGAPLPGQGKEGEAAEVRLGIEQLFEFPGKRSLRLQTGRLGAEIAVAELERVKRIVSAEVKRAYWKAVFAQEAVRALEKSSGRLDLLLGDLQAKYHSGTTAYADVLRARAEKARLRNQILEQHKEKRLAALALNELLALPTDAAVELTSGMPVVPLTAAPEAVWESARSSSPSLHDAALRQERAAAAVKLAGLSRVPDLLAGFSLPSVRTRAWGLSLGLTLPFLRPGRARGLALEAGADMEGARLASAARERHLRSALESAYASAKAAEEQVRVFERDLLRELEDELRIQLEYFRYGRTEAYALLDLYRTFVLAELEHLRAVLLYNLALADLEVAGEESY